MKKIMSILITFGFLFIVLLMGYSPEVEAADPCTFASIYSEIGDDGVFQYWAGNNTYMVKGIRSLYASNTDPATYDDNYVKHDTFYSTEQGVTLIFENDDEQWNAYHNDITWIDTTRTSLITCKGTGAWDDVFSIRFGYGNTYLFDGINFEKWKTSTSANGGSITFKNCTMNMTRNDGIWFSSVSPGTYNFENVVFGTSYATTPVYGIKSYYVPTIFTNCSLDWMPSTAILRPNSDAEIVWIGGDVIPKNKVDSYTGGTVDVWYRGIINESGAYGGELTAMSMIDNQFLDTTLGDGYINIAYIYSDETQTIDLTTESNPTRYSIVPPEGKLVTSVTINDVEMTITDNVFYYNNTDKDPYINITYADQISGVFPMMDIYKNPSVTIASRGDDINYTFYVNNTGTKDTTEVWMNDTIPSNVVFVSGSNTSGTGSVAEWEFTDIAIGTGEMAWLNVTIKDTVVDGELIGNMALCDYRDGTANRYNAMSNVAYTQVYTFLIDALDALNGTVNDINNTVDDINSTILAIWDEFNATWTSWESTFSEYWDQFNTTEFGNTSQMNGWFNTTWNMTADFEVNITDQISDVEDDMASLRTYVIGFNDSMQSRFNTMATILLDSDNETRESFYDFWNEWNQTHNTIISGIGNVGDTTEPSGGITITTTILFILVALGIIFFAYKKEVAWPKIVVSLIVFSFVWIMLFPGTIGWIGFEVIS